MNATIQYDITGDQGGTWHAVIKDGACAVNQGAAATPNLTLTMSSQDWLDMIGGKLSGQMAFMSGKLKLKGDMGLAMKVGLPLLRLGSIAGSPRPVGRTVRR